MPTPVCFSQISCLPRCFVDCVVKNCARRVSLIVFGVLAAVSMGIAIEGAIKPRMYAWVYPTSYVVFGLSYLGVMITLCCQPMKSIGRKEVLLDPDSISSEYVHRLVHELCEKELDGTFKACDLQRMKEILAALTNEKSLNVINSIPSYDVSKQRSHLALPTTRYTPLQHWASKGDLQAVQLLVKHGAVDYPARMAGKKIPTTSALYAAMMQGHVDIVSYLLQNGAQPTVAFDNNLLTSFIPQLIYDLCQKISFGEPMVPLAPGVFTSLERVLVALSSKQSEENLRMQLQVPIFRGKNSYNWVERLDANSPDRNMLLQLLGRFGGAHNNVLSNEELTKYGSIDTGFSLQDTAAAKNS